MAETKKVNIELEVDTNIVNSGVNPYQKIIWLARAFDAWRIFPRAFIGAYIYLLVEVVLWFMDLQDPNMNQAALVSVVVGAGAAWFGLYVNSRGDGKDTIDVKPQQIIIPPTETKSTAPVIMPSEDNRG